MKTTMLAVAIFALAGTGVAPVEVFAQQKDCPPEVAQAQTALKDAQTAAKSKPAAKGPQDVQAPRAQAGARTQDVNAPRTQDVNAPRQQDVNAPRQQDVNAPRQQDVSAPRTQDVNAPRQQDVNAPRQQDVNAPRTQDVNAPRTQDVNAPRTQDVNAPRSPAGDKQKSTTAGASQLKKAEGLVSQAEAACKKGDLTGASAKAKQALALLNK